MHTLFQDLRFALRIFRKKPAITAIALLTMGLGIGANTAIFSVVKALLLSPLPYQNANQLVMVWGKLPTHGLDKLALSGAEFVDYRDRNQVFSAVAVYGSNGRNLTGVNEPERINVTFATADFFSVLDRKPLKGRTFLAEEDRPGNDAVVVLSYNLWQKQFGGDPNIVGQTISLDGRSQQVIGVMPAGFQFPDADTALWKPMAFTGEDLNEDNRGSHFLNLIARMKPGVELKQAQADVSAIAGQMQQEHPGHYVADSGWGATVISLHEETVGDVRLALVVLMVAVAFVLAIACANVANLLLAQAATRQRELVIRSALGAGRWRIIRQLLVESLTLSILGAGLGVLLAQWGVDLLVSLSPESLPRAGEIHLDGSVLGFTFALAVLTGLLFGLVPAWQAARLNLNDSLKESGGKMSEGKNRQRLRNLLVVGEVALALVLFTCAGLMMKSLYRLQQVDPGFDPTNVLTLRISLPQLKYSEPQKQRAFFDALVKQADSLPEVKSVGLVNYLPLSGSGNQRNISVEGKPQNPINVEFRQSTPDYFRALGLELRSGRLFDESDHENAPYVTVINERCARIFFPDEEPLGKRIKMGGLDSPFRWLTIVGVIKDVKHRGLEKEARPEMYIPYRQPPLSNWNVQSMFLAVRTAGAPQNLIPHLRGVVKGIDPEQPVFSIASMQQLISKSTAPRQFNLLLMGLFAALALVLSAGGVYGVLSYSITQRTAEIGIRRALGAQTADVLKLVIKQGMSYALAGIGVGLIAAFVLTRLIENLLFQVSARDLVTFMTVAVILTGVALVACLVPARRATKVDPMVALRYE
jgi:putative ABC transport system permease protein